MSKPEKYYAPYLSDSDTGYSSDSSEGSDTTNTSSGSETVEGQPLNPPDFRQFASDLQLTQASAPSFTQEEKIYNRRQIGLQMSPFDAPRESLSNLYLQKDPSGADIEKTIDFGKQTVTSIVMLDSTNRDKKVFPQPTNVTLRLPRPYKNVTNFQIIQIKLLSSFFYFRVDKNNVSITIHEQGRYLPPGATSGPLNAITSFIREGTYNINTLITELQTQLNRTPLFYDYPGGFSEFVSLFASTGDYSLNFNQPGDNYFDALNNQFIQNPTMTQIVQKYFQTVNAGLASYTLDQIKIAYYYPVLKEILLDLNYDDTLNFNIPDTSALLPTETIRSRIIYTFQGINDSIVLQVVNLNLVELDEYRLSKTFRFSLINRYTISYQTNNNRLTITSSQLNTSLTNLLNGKFSQYLNEQLLKYRITQAQYNTLSGANALLLAILTDMYFYIQRQFAIYFGVNFNTYSLPYYTNIFNQIPLQNAFNSSGISSNFDAQVIQKNVVPQTLNELSTFRTQPNSYWNTLTSLSNVQSGFFNMNSNSTISSFQQLGRVWNSILDRQEPSTALIQDFTPFSSNTSLSSARIYQNKLYQSADIVTDIDNTQYTVFRFKSGVRQTMRVAAFPRPTKYRYPAYNAIAYDEEKQRLFDASYAFIDTDIIRTNLLQILDTSPLLSLPGSADASYFGSNFTTMYSLWTSSNITLNLLNSRTFFEFQTPVPPSAPTAINYTYTLSFSVVNSPLTSNFASPISVFLYHDFPAFIADISDVRNEKPLHYFMSNTFSNTTIGTVSFTAYSRQTYYCMVRSRDTAFTPMDFRLVAFYPNGTSYTSLTSTLTGFDPLANPLSNLTNYNYASLADSNFLRLPINELGNNSNNGVDSNLSIYGDNYVKIGYDENGVSTDLTNYIGYAPRVNASYIDPKATFRIDPTNGYIFQSVTPYNSNTQQYFGPGSSNKILTQDGKAPYTPTTVSQREFTIAQYYDNTFIYPTPLQPYVPLSTLYSLNFFDEQISTNIGSLPYFQLTTLPFFFQSNGVIDFQQVDAFFSNYFNNFYSDPNNQNLIPPDPLTGIQLTGYQYKPIPGFLPYLSLGNGVCGISLIPDDGVWDIDRLMLRSPYKGAREQDPNREIKYLGIFINSYALSLYPEDIKLSNAFMVLEFSNATTYNQSFSNFGFSPQYGTYYEWVKSKTYVPFSNQYIYGYAQSISTMNTDSNSFYSILPFKADGTLTSYVGLCGVPVPYYPFYNIASTGTTYLDGSTTPDGKGIVYPVIRSNADVTRGPPSDGYFTQAKYEQSIPVTNSVLQYLEPKGEIYSLTSSMKKFGPSTFSSNVGVPTFTDSVFRVDGYALFNQAGNFDIYQIPPSTTDMIYNTTLTADMFGVGLSTPQLVGVSGSESEFAFLSMETQNVSKSGRGFYQNSVGSTVTDAFIVTSNNNRFAYAYSQGPNFCNPTVVTLSTGTYSTYFASENDDGFSFILNQAFQNIGVFLYVNLTTSSNLLLRNPTSFSVSFLNYPETAMLLGFNQEIYEAQYSVDVFFGPQWLISSPNKFQTDLLSTFSYRFQIDTYNPREGILRNRDVLTSSNAFYFPPLPSNYREVLPGYPEYPALGEFPDFEEPGEGYPPGSLLIPATYTAQIPNVHSFGYTNQGGYSFGYSISYTGLNPPNKPIWPPIEWWAASKVSSVSDTSTVPYIVQPRYTRSLAFGFCNENFNPTTSYDIATTFTGEGGIEVAKAVGAGGGYSRQEILDTPFSPLGNFYIAYFTAASNISSELNPPKYEYRDYVRGTSPPGAFFKFPTPEVLYTDFSVLSTNTVTPRAPNPDGSIMPGPYEYNFPIVQPWGNPTDFSTLSTVVHQPIYPLITGINLVDAADFAAQASNQQRAYGIVKARTNGTEQQLMVGYEFFEMQANGGLCSTTFLQFTGSNTTSFQYFLDYLFYRSPEPIQSYQGSNIVPYDFKTGAKGGFWITFNEGNRTQGSLIILSNSPSGILAPEQSLINGNELRLGPFGTSFSIEIADETTANFFGFSHNTLYTASTNEAGDYYISSPNTTSILNIQSGLGLDAYVYTVANPITLDFTGAVGDTKSLLRFYYGTYFSSITTGNTPEERIQPYAAVWGNRNNRYDNPVSMKNAYQIFYPTQRIVMKKIKRNYDPMTDLSGILYPEWQHTNMFAYNSYSNYVADISSNKWGLETSNNFMVADTNFSGNYYNAAILNVPLQPSSNYYYLAVRGYSPSEKSQVMLRFSLPNQYDFGYATFRDISNEIFLYPSTVGTFNSNYGNMLLAFNSNFVFDSNGRVFGSNIVQGFNGSNFSNVTGFGDFLKRFAEIYNVYNSNVQLLTEINGSVQSNINQFILTDLRFILPPNALQRQRYTDPIIYSILWKTALPPEYLTLEDNWGLGWNLGYDKADTPYDTTHVAQSFYKILDDFINLKLNPEYDMNRIDTGAKENLSATLEPTGSLKAYYGKLLLAPFGSYAQTIISNPVSFQLPIPRIEKMSFTWTDNLGVTIDNADCEWNLVVQIVESLEPGKPAQPPRIMPR